MTSICDTLPYDCLHELGALFQCALVNRTFSETALPSLYKHIEMTCDFSSVRNGHSFSYPALKTLDRRPYLKPFVRSLELHVLGWSTETLVAPSTDVLASLTNLTSFTIREFDGRLHPVNDSILRGFLDNLTRCAHLVEVHILCPAANSSDVIRQLSNFPSVRRVTLTKPMPALLFVEPEGLVDSKVMEAMQSWDSLAILGPFYVRPHTLPQMDNLRSFTFGAHHRFDKYQLLNLLSKFPNLTDLDIYYDDFLNVGPRVHSSREPKFSGFAFMKNLIVRHQGVGSLGAYTELFRWVKLVASRSPLTGLSIIADDERECRLPFFKATKILLDWIPAKPDLMLLNIPYVQLSNADLQWALSNSNIEVLSMYFSTAETLMIDPTKSSLVALYLRSKIQHTSLTKTMVHVVKSSSTLKRVNSGRKFRALPLVQMLWTVNPLSLRRGVDPLED
ncbi:hypothetical protein IW261DRAFT_1495471 [Armillaria novae-zelandiae]|uniref:Uncharacterized protein n=1 Tax=Armillaria novae-zelandiae TaxID=153914 RepID=A0AA39P0T3_9AGAR|nr:hypothetical protein IW261DRAFT_1495471 [Armillaria novae-zelandiae]